MVFVCYLSRSVWGTIGRRILGYASGMTKKHTRIQAQRAAPFTSKSDSVLEVRGTLTEFIMFVTMISKIPKTGVRQSQGSASL